MLEPKCCVTWNTLEDHGSGVRVRLNQVQRTANSDIRDSDSEYRHMANAEDEATAFFAQIEGMSGAQLAARGRIGQMQQRWMSTPWNQRDQSLETLAFATTEIFGLLHGQDQRVEAVRDVAGLGAAPSRGTTLAIHHHRRQLKVRSVPVCFTLGASVARLY